MFVTPFSKREKSPVMVICVFILSTPVGNWPPTLAVSHLQGLPALPAPGLQLPHAGLRCCPRLRLRLAALGHHPLPSRRDTFLALLWPPCPSRGRCLSSTPHPAPCSAPPHGFRTKLFRKRKRKMDRRKRKGSWGDISPTELHQSLREATASYWYKSTTGVLTWVSLFWVSLFSILQQWITLLIMSSFFFFFF